MLRPVAFIFGEPLSPSEFATARNRIVPRWRVRCPRMPAAAMLAAMHHFTPHRLEHEVNRKRGLAFDSGEAGFSHVVIS